MLSSSARVSSKRRRGVWLGVPSKRLSILDHGSPYHALMDFLTAAFRLPLFLRIFLGVDFFAGWA